MPRKAAGILLIGDYPPPMGGIAVHVQQLHRAFGRTGLNCRVLDIGKGGAPDPGVVSGHGYKNFARELFRHAAGGWLLHFHTSGNNPKAWTVAAAVAAAGQLCRVPTVLTVHSGLVPQLFPRSSALRRRARRALLGYTHVVAVSDAVRETLAELGLNNKRVSSYPAFIASEVQPGEPPPLLAESRARRRPLLSAAHNVSPVYGRTLMFEALAKLVPSQPEVGLAIFGPGTGTDEYRADAERFGVAAHLDDFGELSNAQALAVIGASDVFVRPTTADGDSVSVREALTLGVPVVATDVAKRPAGTVVCRAGDAADLARMIEHALVHRPLPTPQPDCAAFLAMLYAELVRPRTKRAPPPQGEPDKLLPAF